MTDQEKAERVDAEIKAAGPLPQNEEEFTKWVGAATFPEAVETTIRSSIQHGHLTEEMFLQIKAIAKEKGAAINALKNLMVNIHQHVGDMRSIPELAEHWDAAQKIVKTKWY